MAAKEAKKVVKTSPKTEVKKPIVVKDSFNKTALLNSLVEATELTKKQVVSVIDTLTQIIEAHVSKKGPGAFVWPGVAKFYVVRKPATKAHEGVNPFTKEPMTFAAKPARNVLKIRPLKKLKDVV